MALSKNELIALNKIGDVNAVLRQRFGKDGEQIDAFFLDLKDRLLRAPDLTSITSGTYVRDIEALLNIPTALLLEALRGQRDFKIWSPSTWDVTKPMRLAADEYARTFGFERYKKLRSL